MEQKHFNYKLLLVVSLLILIPAYASQYEVSSGDNLSNIAHSKFRGKVWGVGGSMEKILKLNSSITNQNLIYPGDFINTEESAHDSVQVQEPIVETISENATVPVPPAKSAHSVMKANSLIFSPLLSFSKISATQRSNRAKTVLASDLNYGLEIVAAHHWSDQASSSLIFSAESIHYTTTGRLSPARIIAGDLALSTTIGAYNEIQWGFSVGAVRRFIVISSSPNSLFLNPLTDVTAGPSLSIPFWRSDSFALKFDNAVNLLLGVAPSLYSVSPGYKIGSKLKLTKLRSATPFNTCLFANYLNQNTSITDQNDFELGISIGFYFDI